MKTLLALMLSLVLSDVAFSQAVWRGRQYSSPVCNSPNCRMCNTIRAQLSVPAFSQDAQTVKLVPPKEIATPKLTHVTELVPTPADAIDTAMQLLALNKDSIFIEPGCGDGQVLAKASEVSISIGIDLNRDSVLQARANAPKAIVIQGDVLSHQYDNATNVYMYLYPELMEKIIGKLKKGTKVVSYMHRSPSMQWTEHAQGVHVFYTGTK